MGRDEDAREREEATLGGGGGHQDGLGSGLGEEAAELGGVAGGLVAEDTDQPDLGGRQVPARTAGDGLVGLARRLGVRGLGVLA